MKHLHLDARNISVWTRLHCTLTRKVCINFDESFRFNCQPKRRATDPTEFFDALGVFLKHEPAPAEIRMAPRYNAKNLINRVDMKQNKTKKTCVMCLSLFISFHRLLWGWFEVCRVFFTRLTSWQSARETWRCIRWGDHVLFRVSSTQSRQSRQSPAKCSVFVFFPQNQVWGPTPNSWHPISQSFESPAGWGSL